MCVDTCLFINRLCLIIFVFQSSRDPIVVWSDRRIPSELPRFRMHDHRIFGKRMAPIGTGHFRTYRIIAKGHIALGRDCGMYRLSRTKTVQNEP